MAIENISPLLAIPLSYTFFTVLSLLNTLVFFDATVGGAADVAGVWVGVVMILCGVWILALWGGGAGVDGVTE
jgi:hypothetical protein